MRKVLLKHTHLAVTMFVLGMFGIMGVGIIIGLVASGSTFVITNIPLVLPILMFAAFWLTFYPMYNFIVYKIYLERRLLIQNNQPHTQQQTPIGLDTVPDDIDGDGRGDDTLRRMGITQ